MPSNNEEGAPPSPELIAAVYSLVDRHLTQSVAIEDWVQTVEYDSTIPRWYVRFGCDGRDAATIYFDLHQRSLHYELYFLPDPPSGHLELYRSALRWNHDLYGAKFSLGPDGDLYLTGRILLEHIDSAELDRVIGVLYVLTERYFQAAVRIGYSNK